MSYIRQTRRTEALRLAGLWRSRTAEKLVWVGRNRGWEVTHKWQLAPSSIERLIWGSWSRATFSWGLLEAPSLRRIGIARDVTGKHRGSPFSIHGGKWIGLIFLTTVMQMHKPATYRYFALGMEKNCLLKALDQKREYYCGDAELHCTNVNGAALWDIFCVQ